MVHKTRTGLPLELPRGQPLHPAARFDPVAIGHAGAGETSRVGEQVLNRHLALAVFRKGWHYIHHPGAALQQAITEQQPNRTSGNRLRARIDDEPAGGRRAVGAAGQELTAACHRYLARRQKPLVDFTTGPLKEAVQPLGVDRRVVSAGYGVVSWVVHTLDRHGPIVDALRR